MELHVDIRWLLDRQEELLGKDLTVRDYSALVAAVARHRVNTPSLTESTPDAHWRAAALLEQIILLRPLPVRSELFAYGVATAYLEASGERADTSYEPWRDLIRDIQALRLTVYDVADRLRSWGDAGPPD
ncbi:toxin Doc [Streptomyces sp. NPDC004778]